MRLSRLYCNLPDLFVPIRFNASGSEFPALSVIFARITKPRDRNRDSHNLGKTTLIHLIDFMLLKDIADQKHFLSKHSGQFSEFIFYLEIWSHTGELITVRRSVKEPTQVALRRRSAADCEDALLYEDALPEWDHVDLPLTTARTLLDTYLDLRIVKPWNYRKGVSYFLRTQADYQDYFQIAKFTRGQDAEWKPYLAHVLGLNAKIIEHKYDQDKKIADADRRRNERQAEVQIDEREYNKLANQIEIQRQELEEISENLDGFDFREEERRVNRDVVDRIESRIAELNDAIYNIDFELSQIRGALKSGSDFKIDEVRQIFDETSTYFPDQLKHDYEQLVNFNKKVTHERNVLLRRQVKKLEEDKNNFEGEAGKLNDERRKYLHLLREADTFNKFKSLQRRHAEQRGNLSYLENQLERLNKVREISQEVRDFTLIRDRLVAEITADVEREATVIKRVAIEFHNLVRRVIGQRGQFYVNVNRSGNVEFNINIELDSISTEISSQSEGTSYKKLLCALFDIALLKVYAKAPFYHFVYHDGIFEGLDNRKRTVLLDVLRETVRTHGIQYILSAIDTDLPRNAKDAKILFEKNEVVLTLDDSGIKGRLFRIEEF